jgi:leader peptidase (prepilin peptidase)/N-methyltransferase
VIAGYLLLVLGGAAVGSFLNVVAHRLPRGDSIVHPRSRCPRCGTPLRGVDNVPIVSWLALHGRCRTCGASISPRYPAVELLTVAAFAGVAAIRGFDADLLLELPFVAVLIAVSVIDLEHRIIPNAIVYPAALWAVAATAIVDVSSLPENLIAGAGALTFLLVATLAYPAGMGMGDVKLGGTMGLYLGLSVIPALLVAFAAGSIVGLGMIAREGLSARKKGVPFGIFLAVGGLVGVLAGPDLIDLYEDAFLSA